ncbi:MAG: hypothetical protein IJG15_05120, partial [Lachnospiraceae bacterium]|nr:hypothetical protein [Lachnospiraceae bacterium]
MGDVEVRLQGIAASDATDEKPETAEETSGLSAPPDDETVQAALEAILFAMGDAVPIDSIARALAISRDRAVQAAD